jgi:hypothetical protein
MKPFSKKKHVGCYNMIKACATNDASDANQWFQSNWTAWKLGFSLCCNSKYNPTLCDELDDALFNFTDRSFSGGNLVGETPDPQLADFCMEADGLMETHFSHMTFERDEVTETSASAAMLAQTLTSKAASGALTKVVSNAGMKSGLTKLFARASAHSRAQVIQARVSQCQATTNCWDEVAIVRPLLLQIAERANQTLGCLGPSEYSRVRYLCHSKHTSGSCTASCHGVKCCWWDGKCKMPGVRECNEEHEESCFPAGARVALSTSTGDVAVEQLRRGAQVWSPEFSGAGAGYSQGASTAEYMINNHAFDVGFRTKVLDFVEISHESMRLGRPLLITGEHLLFVRRTEGQEPSWQLERARAVREGDVVLSLDAVSNIAHPSSITRVRWVKAQGAYAPLTTSGRLFVEGVAVSSLALSEPRWQQAWDDLEEAPERRTLWAERLLLLSLIPSRTLNYFGMDFDWLHKPSQTDLGKRAANKILGTFFL